MVITISHKGEGRAAVEGVVAAAAVAATVASQFNSGLTPVYFACWLSLLVLTAAQGRDRLVFGGYSIAFVLAGLLGLPLFLFLSVVFGEPGYLSGFYPLLLKTLFMYLMGYCLYASDRISSVWKALLAAYLVSAAVYAIWMMATYFPGLGVWLDSVTYLFSQKNSAGQIIGVACLVAILLAGRFGRGMRMVFYLFAAAVFAVVALMQCRTAMLGCFAAFVCLLWGRGHRGVLAVFVAGALLLYLAIPDFRSIVDHALFLDKYESATLDTMSSGRFGLWGDALIVFTGSALFGVGSYYVDNMYVNCLANVGLVGALFFLGLWVWRVVENFRRLEPSPNGSHGRMGFEISRWLPALTVFYLVESLLEGLPPFGPGSCAFIFWMMCGFVDAQRSAERGPRFARPRGLVSH